MTEKTTTVPAWRRALHLAIQEIAGPPVGPVDSIEEHRDGGDHRPCRECGDRGAGVTITTRAVPDPAHEAGHEPKPGERQRYVWCEATYDGTLADLLDAVETGELDLAWVRHHI